MKNSTRRRGLAASAVVTVLSALVASCGGEAGGEDANATGGSDTNCTEDVTVVVHTGPGGGADLLAREVVAMMEKEEIIEPGGWTVENREGGDGAIAMNYMREQAGRPDIIMFSSNVHLSNGMVTEGVDVDSLDLTPIAGLYIDKMAVAVAADGPYESLEDFIADAKAHPGELVQSGGSTTSVDAMSGQVLQRESGAEWQFLSFESGGDRKTALLRGDSQLYMTEPIDMVESVESGDMVAVAVMGDEKSELLPDAPTTVELGYEAQLPEQIRGVLGTADMPEDAVDCYVDAFTELTETDTWADFVDHNDVSPTFLDAQAYADKLQEQKAQFKELFEETGQLVEE